MRHAISLAARHHPHPNPRVGAILVGSDGSVLGEYAHRQAGETHAELGLLERVEEVPVEATLVVTLEPCVHTGRTPPCVDAIVAAGVRHVIVGSVDPDERVSGRGLAALREAGIEVEVGVEQQAVEDSDPGYFHHRRTGLPLVTLKQATTLDGQTAAADGSSRWITGTAAREDAHRLRSLYDAVLVGAGTVRADDPRLDVRLTGYDGPQPVPVLVAGRRPLPADLRVWDRHPIVIASDEASLPGLDVIRAGSGGVVDLRAAMEGLAARGLLSVLVEGGAGIAAALWESGLVARGTLYLAGKMAGGTGRGAFDRVFSTLTEAVDVEITSIVHLGPDLRIDWRVAGPS
jgi:diaminohydroxyphosphoribosylaminopyrimidine deaminase / 5-amino-6-(5-phosphoribosylamino)uracil reductase